MMTQFTGKHCRIDQPAMHGELLYNVRLGPNICGLGAKKVHIPFKHEGKNHLITKDIQGKAEVSTHPYTLIVINGGTYEELINTESVPKGSLTKDQEAPPQEEQGLRGLQAR